MTLSDNAPVTAVFSCRRPQGSNTFAWFLPHFREFKGSTEPFRQLKTVVTKAFPHKINLCTLLNSYLFTYAKIPLKGIGETISFEINFNDYNERYSMKNEQEAKEEWLSYFINSSTYTLIKEK